jgi:hypothetical protein
MNFIHDDGNGVLTNDAGDEVVEYQMEVILGFKASRKAFKGTQGKREDIIEDHRRE